MGTAAPVIEQEMADWVKLGGRNSGIVGNAAHTYGFHCAADEVPASDYSRTRDPNGSDGPYPNWDYACAGDFRHDDKPALLLKTQQLLARLQRGELPMICEFIGRPWPGKPVYYWARWNGVATLQRYTGAGHDTWSHVSWYRSRANQRAYLWVPTSAPAPTPPSGSGDDLDMDANEVFNAVWHRDQLRNPYGDAANNKTIYPETALFNIGNHTEATMVELRALRADMVARDEADKVRDAANAAAVKGLVDAIGKLTSGGGSVEAAPIIAAVNAVGAEAKTKFAELQTALAAQKAESERLRAKLAEAAKAEADALAKS